MRTLSRIMPRHSSSTERETGRAVRGDVGLIDLDLMMDGVPQELGDAEYSSTSDAFSKFGGQPLGSSISETDYVRNAFVADRLAPEDRCTYDSDKSACTNYPYRYAWSYPGWTMAEKFETLVTHPHALRPLATPENFAQLWPKPYLELTFSTPLSIDRIGLRQRHMAWADATMRTADVFVNDFRVGVVDFGSPRTPGDTGTLRTNLTFPEPDAYGRSGLAKEMVLVFPRADARTVRIVVTSVHSYDPPADLLEGQDADHTRWNVSRMESEHRVFYDYVHPTMGTWNVGLTHVALYDGADLVPEGDILRASAESNGRFRIQDL